VRKVWPELPGRDALTTSFAAATAPRANALYSSIRLSINAESCCGFGWMKKGTAVIEHARKTAAKSDT